MLGDEVVERAAQVRHGQALVDGEALDLVEDRGVRRVEVVGAEHLAGADDVDRRLALEHGADLHRRGLGAQHQAGVGRVDEEGVLHLPGRVVLAEVERVEVEPLGLDLGALGDLPAHADEGVDEPLGRQLQRVARAGRAAGTGAVTSTRSSTRIRRVALGLELGLAARRAPGRPGRGPAPTRLPASALALGGSAPISRLARASGLRSPWCAIRAALSSSREAAAAMAARAASHRCVERCRVERGDLDRVVLRVGSGHRFRFVDGRAARRGSRSGRARGGRRSQGGQSRGRAGSRLRRRGPGRPAGQRKSELGAAAGRPTDADRARRAPRRGRARRRGPGRCRRGGAVPEPGEDTAGARRAMPSPSSSTVTATASARRRSVVPPATPASP